QQRRAAIHRAHRGRQRLSGRQFDRPEVGLLVGKNEQEVARARYDRRLDGAARSGGFATSSITHAKAQRHGPYAGNAQEVASRTGAIWPLIMLHVFSLLIRWRHSEVLTSSDRDRTPRIASPGR